MASPRCWRRRRRVQGFVMFWTTSSASRKSRSSKSAPRVYDLAPEHMKVTNPELGFISANSWDINGAASAGLNAFWIQRSAAEVPEELGFQASAIVKAITDLAPLLRG